MNKLAKSAVLAGSIIAISLTSIADASAGDRKKWKHHKKHTTQHEKSLSGADIAAIGILGIGAGIVASAIIADQNAPQNFESDFPEPPRSYRSDHRRSYGDEDRGTYRRSDNRQMVYSDYAEPWTKPWYRYCSDRYRSFNPRTGTYRGYDGQEHFCTTN